MNIKGYTHCGYGVAFFAACTRRFLADTPNITATCGGAKFKRGLLRGRFSKIISWRWPRQLIAPLSTAETSRKTGRHVADHVYVRRIVAFIAICIRNTMRLYIYMRGLFIYFWYYRINIYRTLKDFYVINRVF